MLTAPLTIVQLAIEDITKYERNPRKHSPKQIAMLKKSILRYGFNNPVLVGPPPKYEAIAGDARMEAAGLCGYKSVPAIILPHLDEAQRRAFRIADNNIALKATWSMQLLRTEVEFLLDSDFEFEPDELGFETGEFDFLLSDETADADAPPVPEARRDRPATSVMNDLWTCAGHRLLCGNSLLFSSYGRLMGDEKAAAVVTDMPWNRSKGEIGGLGKIQHPDFAMASGEMSDLQFKQFMREAFEHQVAFSRDGAICLNFIDWRSVAPMIFVGEEMFTGGLINVCVWSKQTGGMGSMWRSRHELVCAFKSGNAKHTNNVMLGKWGRNRTNVWEYPAPLGWGGDRKNLELHPTSKNVDMLADAIMDITDRGDLVLDPFLGSGATSLAAHKTGRIIRGIDIDPYYVDVCIERLVEATGEDAIDAHGVTFATRRVQAGGEA